MVLRELGLVYVLSYLPRQLVKGMVSKQRDVINVPTLERNGVASKVSDFVIPLISSGSEKVVFD